MRISLVLAALTLLTAVPAAAQAPPGEQGPKVIQRGAQPNPEEVRPSSPQGDAPSASAGQLRQRQARRILGLPVSAVIVVAGILVVLLVVASVVIPRPSRRQRARGGGTYGR
jgi:hypothetical protein